MSLIRRLGKETVIYGFGKAVSSAIAIFFVPIYTRLLGSEGYGFVDTISVAVSFLFIITVAGLDSAAGFYYFDVKTDNEKRTVLFNGLLFRSAASIILPVLVFPAFWIFLAQRSVESHAAIPFVILGLLRIPFMTLQNFCRDTMRLENRVWPFFWTTLIYSLLAVLFPILLVIVLRRGVLGVFEAALAAEALTGLLFLAILRRRLRPHVDTALIKRLLVYGLPILPTSFMFYAMASTDRFFILGKLGLSSAGLYAVGNKLALIVAFAVGSYQLAWGVFGLSIKDHPEARVTYSRVLTLYSIGFGFLSIAITLFSFEGLVLLATPEFYPAAGIIGFLCMAQFINGMYNQVCIGSVITKKTINIPISGAAGLIVNLVGNMVLIDLWGLPGAAIATLMGYAVCVLVLYALSQKAYPIDYKIVPVLAPVMMALAASVIIIFLPKQITIPGVVVKAVILLLIGVLFFAMEKHYRKRT